MSIQAIGLVRKYRGGRAAGLPEIWPFKELLRRLVIRNLVLKYQRSTLGFVWTLANPLLMISVLSLVFSRVVRIGIPDYWAFLLSGYFAWNFVTQMLSSGTYVLAEHAHLSRGAPVPPEVPILAATFSRLIEFSVELTVAAAALAIFHHHEIPPSFALVPLVVFLQVLLVLGLTMPIATLSVFYRDVQHILPIVIMVLWYITPVFYPIKSVPVQLRFWFSLNPLTQAIRLFHVVLYYGHFPDWDDLLSVAIWSVVAFLAGYWFLRRNQSLFPEIL